LFEFKGVGRSEMDGLFLYFFKKSVDLVVLLNDYTIIENHKRKKTMKTYEIDYYKTEGLTPDELNVMRSNQSGIWLCGQSVKAESQRKAIVEAKKIYGDQKIRISNNR